MYPYVYPMHPNAAPRAAPISYWPPNQAAVARLPAPMGSYPVPVYPGAAPTAPLPSYAPGQRMPIGPNAYYGMPQANPQNSNGKNAKNPNPKDDKMRNLSSNPEIYDMANMKKSKLRVSKIYHVRKVKAENADDDDDEENRKPMAPLPPPIQQNFHHLPPPRGLPKARAPRRAASPYSDSSYCSECSYEDHLRHRNDYDDDFCIDCERERQEGYRQHTGQSRH